MVLSIASEFLEFKCNRELLLVAIANKLARIGWAVLFRGEDYRYAAAAA
jgi:hypothetical protein